MAKMMCVHDIKGINQNQINELIEKSKSSNDPRLNQVLYIPSSYFPNISSKSLARVTRIAGINPDRSATKMTASARMTKSA